MNDNARVIRDKLIVGLNAVCRVTLSIILEEREFLVGHTKRWGITIFYIPWNIFLQINNYMGKARWAATICVFLLLPYLLIYVVKVKTAMSQRPQPRLYKYVEAPPEYPQPHINIDLKKIYILL